MPGRGSPGGFTLIEVLVALVILSIGIVLVLRAFETSAVALGQSRDALLGTVLARETVADFEARAAAGETLPAVSSDEFDAGLYAGLSRRSELQPVSAGASGNSPQSGTGAWYRVSVAVSRGDTPAYEVSTYIRRSSTQ